MEYKIFEIEIRYRKKRNKCEIARYSEKLSIPKKLVGLLDKEIEMIDGLTKYLDDAVVKEHGIWERWTYHRFIVDGRLVTLEVYEYSKDPSEFECNHLLDKVVVSMTISSALPMIMDGWYKPEIPKTLESELSRIIDNLRIDYSVL